MKGWIEDECMDRGLREGQRMKGWMNDNIIIRWIKDEKMDRG